MSTLDVPAVPVPHIAAAPAPAVAPVAPPVDAPAPAPAPPLFAPAPLPFLEALPEGMMEGVSLPLLYRLAAPVPYDARAGAQRAAEDPEHGSSMLACTPFYKPVSRCIGGRG
ncbi:MAG: hypothetical protein JWM27_2353 [Gemmatimonadetes bacterium]|nr:hypothetical protein [Gemmatimonadota bacterium]